MSYCIFPDNWVKFAETDPYDNLGDLYANLRKPDVDFKEPDVDFKEPDVDFKKPDVDFEEPDVDLEDPYANLGAPDVTHKPIKNPADRPFYPNSTKLIKTFPLRGTEKVLGALFATHRYHLSPYTQITMELTNSRRVSTKLTHKIRDLIISLYVYGNQQFIDGFSEKAGPDELYKISAQNFRKLRSKNITNLGIPLEVLGEQVAETGANFRIIARNIAASHPQCVQPKKDLTTACRLLAKSAFFSQEPLFMRGYAKKTDPTKPFGMIQKNTDKEICASIDSRTIKGILVSDIAKAYAKYPNNLIQITRTIELLYPKIPNLYNHLSYYIRMYKTANTHPDTKTPESRLFLKIFAHSITTSPIKRKASPSNDDKESRKRLCE